MNQRATGPVKRPMRGNDVAGRRLVTRRLVTRRLVTRRRPRAATALLLVAAAGAAAFSSAPDAVATARSEQTPVLPVTTTFTCVTGGAKAMTVGHPDINFAPTVQSVQLVPDRGGIILEYKFGSALAAPPEGVYFSWAVYIYRNRGDANHPTRSLELQVQDRGAGWAPTGWTILASTYYASRPVEGNIQTDKARDELTAFFPAGFGNLSRPFYWFASQVSYRAYLPAKTRSSPVNHNIYGSLTTDCPAGVRQDPNSLPYPAKLLLAAK